MPFIPGNDGYGERGSTTDSVAVDEEGDMLQ